MPSPWRAFPNTGPFSDEMGIHGLGAGTLCGVGKTGHLQSINAAVSDARKKAGLPKELVPYCARHDAGGFLMERTGNPRVVMELMGHRQGSTTMRYTHLREEQVASLYEAINSRQNSVVGTQKVHKPN